MSIPAIDVISPVSEIPACSENGSMVGGCHQGNADRRFINFTRLCCDLLTAGEWVFFKWLFTNYPAHLDFDYVDFEGNNCLHVLFRAADEFPFVLKALKHIFAREQIPLSVLNRENRYGSTPLHVAAKRSHPFVHKLISHMLRMGAERKQDQFGLAVMTDFDPEMRRRHHCRSHRRPESVVEIVDPNPSVIEVVVAPEQQVVQNDLPNLAELVKIFEKPQASDLRNLNAYTFSPTSPSSIQLQLDGSSDGVRRIERHITGNMHIDGSNKQTKITGQAAVPLGQGFYGGRKKLGSVEGHRHMKTYSEIDGYVSSVSNGSSDMEGGRKKRRSSRSLKRENDKKNDLHTEALKNVEQFLAKVTIPKEFKNLENYLVRAIKAVVYEELKNEEKASGKAINGFKRAEKMVERIAKGGETYIKDILKKHMAKLKEIIEHLQTKTASSSSEPPKKAKGGRRKKRSSSSSSSSSVNTTSSDESSDSSDSD